MTAILKALRDYAFAAREFHPDPVTDRPFGIPL